MNSQSDLEVRRRAKTDFEFWARHFCKIRTKEQQIVPLTLNKVQRDLIAAVDKQYAETGKIRVVVLKARQQGFSTLVSAYLYWKLSQSTARKGFVVANDRFTTYTMFDLYKRIHASVPSILRPKTRRSNRNELVFDKLDTGIMVATAGKDSLGRGETITDVHLSEVAFWPENYAVDNMNALLQSIPDTDGTSVFVESTANGVGGPFYELWQGAVRGENGFMPFFAPWFDTDGYRDDTVPEPEDGIWIEEERLVDLYGLSWPQLAWRRKTIAGPGGVRKFLQEYPATPDEAFLSTGQQVFDTQVLTRADAKTSPPKTFRHLRAGEWCESRAGELSVWHEPEPGQSYWIGADVSSGAARDFSVAQVLDRDKRQVAVWHGKMRPRQFSETLMELGRYYNDAMIGVEANYHGYTVLDHLQHTFYYENIYTDIDHSKITEVPTERLGYYVNEKTKLLIINKLADDIFRERIAFNDRQTVEELTKFIEKDSGKVEATNGYHDDRVMALAIVNHIHDGHYVPIPYEMFSEYYISAL